MQALPNIENDPGGLPFGEGTNLAHLLHDQDNLGPDYLEDSGHLLKDLYHPWNHVRALIDIAEEAATLDEKAATLEEGKEAAPLKKKKMRQPLPESTQTMSNS